VKWYRWWWGQAAAGGLVARTPPVAGSISSNADGRTSIKVSGSVTSPVALDQVNSCRRLDAVTATASRSVVLMMPTYWVQPRLTLPDLEFFSSPKVASTRVRRLNEATHPGLPHFSF
jgi:hypothetical protein